MYSQKVMSSDDAYLFTTAKMCEFITLNYALNK